MDETATDPGFHTIVVGDDGTPAAEAALRFAQQFAAADGRLVLARVFPREPDDREAAELAARAPAGVDAHALSGRSVEHALCRLARELDADLIVAGSDRREGDYRAYKVRGLRLVHGAPCAVAIAPRGGGEEIRRIGVAYDGSPEADLALDAAADRAPAGVNPETVVLSGYASEALAEHAGDRVDLLGLGSRRQGPVTHALLGSTSRATAVEAPCAILITPRGAHLHAMAS